METILWAFISGIRNGYMATPRISFSQPCEKTFMKISDAVILERLWYIRAINCRAARGPHVVRL